MAVNRTQKSKVRKINSMKPAELQEFIKFLHKQGGATSKVCYHAVKHFNIITANNILKSIVFLK